MVKLITILFLAFIFWTFLFAMAEAVAELATCLDKATKRALKKWRRNND